MGMTKQELATRDQLADYLGQEGHGKYAEYLMLFDLHFMSDKEAENGGIAYMIPEKGMIFINKDIDDIDAIDLLLRHEMLHEYLKHGNRYKKILQKTFNLKDDEEPKFKDDLENRAYHKISNMAADWELSKFYSPEKDFTKAKNIPYKDKFLEGLVLELDRPEWLELSYEQLFEKLLGEIDNIKDQIKDSSFDESNMRRSVGEQAEDMENEASEIEAKAAEMEKELNELSKAGKKNGQVEDLKKKLSDLKKKAKQLRDQAEQLKKDVEDRSAAFNEPEAEEERQERLEKIKDFWDKLENKEQLVKDIEARIYSEKRQLAINKKKQADRDYIKNLSVNNIKLEPIKNFVLDLNRTIQKQLSQNDKEVDTFTKKPLAGAAIKGVYRPGQVAATPKRKKPSIQVIYDRSGSWMPAAKTRAGDLALYTLKKKYVDKGLIKLDVFYCSNGPVTSNRAEADKGGNGMNGMAVIEHLNKTKPDNVIIMTDSDPDFYDYYNMCRIPGAAWFLFYGGTAPTFAGHIQAKFKKYYDLTNTAGLQEIVKKYTD